MKNLMSTIIITRKVAAGEAEYLENGYAVQTNSVVTIEDLFQTIQTKPQLLGEDLSVNSERTSFAL